MKVKTVRFNRDEVGMLKKVLSHYRNDFSKCVKDLMAEKLEDLQDIRYIKTIREGRGRDYVDARKINRLFED